MPKRAVFFGLLTAALICGQAIAQAENPQPGAPPAAGQEAPPAAAPTAPPRGAATAPTPSNREITAGCKNDARSKGLRGAAMQSAVLDCVNGQSPQLAARMRCNRQARAQSIARGDAMKAFVRNCVAQGQ
jgi:hypothetical protein